LTLRNLTPNFFKLWFEPRPQRAAIENPYQKIIIFADFQPKQIRNIFLVYQINSFGGTQFKRNGQHKRVMYLIQ